MATLYELTAQMCEIEDVLEEAGGELTPELESLWNETRESLLAKVDDYNGLYRKYEAADTALESEIKRLQRLQKTARNSMKSLKAGLADNMHRFGLRRMDGKYCKVSLRKSSSLEVDESLMLKPYEEAIARIGAALPPYITVETRISKQMIKEMYKGTDTLPAGCSEVERENIQIR